MAEKPLPDLGNPAHARDAREVARWHRETDVVVVGAGGAGVCAALEARAEGAEVWQPSWSVPREGWFYPPTLCAHDIGLKDLMDSLYLLGTPPDVTLYAISISFPQVLGTELSPPLAAIVPDMASRILEDAGKE